MDSEFIDTSFVSFRSPRHIWQNHRSYLIAEIVYYFLAFLTFKHACRCGGRYVYLWFTTIVHSLVVESASYVIPDIDNFWHAQSMVMLSSRRLPLHIVLLYPVFIYTAYAAVLRLRLARWAEPCAVGLSVVLLDVPFDIVGIKQLFWTWHDTDPNIFDRHYHVPWTSYYFHAAFAAGFIVLFNGTRDLIGHKSDAENRMQSDGLLKELVCSLITGLLAMPLGVLQFIPVYHSLHDGLQIHSQVCVLLFITLFGLIAWTCDRRPTAYARTATISALFDELGLLVFVHGAMYMAFAALEEPQSIRSIGLHQTVGDCNATTAVHTPLGQELTKQTYLCLSNYDEPYFDFHCLPGGMATLLQQSSAGVTVDWYTVCGTPVNSRAEYVIVVSAFVLISFWVYEQMLAFSGLPPMASRLTDRQKQQ